MRERNYHEGNGKTVLVRFVRLGDSKCFARQRTFLLCSGTCRKQAAESEHDVICLLDVPGTRKI